MEIVQAETKSPTPQRLWYVGDAFRLGMTTDEIYQLSAIDPWFLEKIREIVVMTKRLPVFGEACEVRCRYCATLEADGLCGCSHCEVIWSHEADGPKREKSEGRRGGIQFRRYLRRGVSSVHALFVFDL